MGERGNIGFVQHGWKKVDDQYESAIDGVIFLYTHWQGYDTNKLAARAIEAAKGRWGDEMYAVRIALTELIGDVSGDTGWGVGITPGENSYPMPIIDFEALEVRVISREEGDTQDVAKILEAYDVARPERFNEFLARIFTVGVEDTL